MIRNYYKKHIALGVLFFVIVFGLVFINLEGTSHDFYWILYNRSYATILYIPLFFCGMIWIFSDFFFSECMVRYVTKIRMLEKYLERIVLFSLYYAGLFLTANLFLQKILKIPIFQIKKNIGMDCMILFFLQIIGWCLLGLLFFLLFLWIRHFAVVWGVLVVLLVVLTSFGETFAESSTVRYVVSPYHMMYQYSLMKSQMVPLKVFIFAVIFCCLLSVIIWLSLKSRDMLMRGE